LNIHFITLYVLLHLILCVASEKIIICVTRSIDLDHHTFHHYIYLGGAPFGTGSDLGGSLRTPAHFHGISSLRPTVNRLSEKGVRQCLPKVDGRM